MYYLRMIQGVPLKTGPFARQNQERVLFFYFLLDYMHALTEDAGNELLLNQYFFSALYKTLSWFRRVSGPVLSGTPCIFLRKHVAVLSLLFICV
jgi:hypothetical protein